MKRLLLSSLVLIAAGLLTVSASAAARMEIDSVVLLQPDFIMKERVPDVAQFAAYIRAVQQAAVGTVAGKRPARHPVDSLSSRFGLEMSRRSGPISGRHCHRL
jgi:hypothetical protein